MKIYFLTRSLYPYQKAGGGQIRLGQITFLKEFAWDITVIMPNYGQNKLKIVDHTIQIPLNYNIRLASHLERIGFYEDYLDNWIKNAFDYLKEKVKKDDIVFATSGGELGMIKLGSLLKKELGCRFIVNYHDPLAYSLVNNLKLNSKFHISREKSEYKYLKNSDLIVTSSKLNQYSLIDKYPKWKNKIVNNYFGYIKQVLLKPKKNRLELSIAYVGNMGNLQTPEILYEAYTRLDSKENIKIYFIGDSKNYKPLKGITDTNIVFIDYLPHEKFLEFMNNNIDIGFVSLTSDYLGACVPSKIYEYINLGLPMIGALPDGDGKEIINQNGYGISCMYDDIDGLTDAIEKFRDEEFLNQCKNKILADREIWSMKERIKEVDELLRMIYEHRNS